MNDWLRHSLFALLPLALAAQNSATSAPGGDADPLMVQLRVVRGEGALYAAGSRTAAAFAVEVTGETGLPVEGAAVSFRLPAAGPGGTFSNGLTTDVVITGPDGRAAVSGIRWNQTPGPFQVRITAAKGQARAGLILSASLEEKASTVTEGPADLPDLATKRSRWITVAIIAGGLAAASAGAGVIARNRTPPAAGTASASALSVGTPVITIGGPQ